jgi:hypothetical protein
MNGSLATRRDGNGICLSCGNLFIAGFRGNRAQPTQRGNTALRETMKQVEALKGYTGFFALVPRIQTAGIFFLGAQSMIRVEK